jgi:hypothetical protein
MSTTIGPDTETKGAASEAPALSLSSLSSSALPITVDPKEAAGTPVDLFAAHSFRPHAFASELAVVASAAAVVNVVFTCVCVCATHPEIVRRF